MRCAVIRQVRNGVFVVCGMQLIEDQLQFVGAAEVQVVAQHLFEEQAARQRTVEDLRPRELDLLHQGRRINNCRSTDASSVRPVRAMTRIWAHGRGVRATADSHRIPTVIDAPVLKTS